MSEVTAPTMKLTLVCVRHGEAEHNLATPTSIAAPRWTEEGNLDTPLTPRGREQAEQVSDAETGALFNLKAHSTNPSLSSS